MPHTPEMVAAAYLHDVVDDTPVSLADVRDMFGERVADLVGWLSDSTLPTSGPRHVRKAALRDRLALAPADVQTVKLADVIDNICDVVDADATFARVDLPEKRDLVDKLTHGDPALWARADALVREGMAQVCLV